MQVSQLCTHTAKLTKKSVESLPQAEYTPHCQGCQANIHSMHSSLNICICLHCSALFCLNKCIYQHEKEAHLYFVKIQNVQQMPSLQGKNGNINIHCKICGNIKEALEIDKASQQEILQQNIQKLLRFSSFIDSICIKLPNIIFDKFHICIEFDSQPEIQTFGLTNLGNTCYLNSTLQILYYTQEFKHLCLSDLKMEIISTEKETRRDIQCYYDEVLQQFESNSWHVVQDKKKMKSKDQTKSSSFLVEGIVKDSNFNKQLSIIFRNINNDMKNINKDMNEKYIFEPIGILNKLGQFDSKYKLSKEQDAQQLLISMLELISQGQMLEVSKNDKERFNKIEFLLGRQKLTGIQQIFGSYLASRVVCLGCQYQSWSLDFTYHYPVPIHTKNIAIIQQQPLTLTLTPIPNIKYHYPLSYPLPSTVYNILSPLFNSQKLTNRDNYYNCDKCQHLTGTKQLFIVDPPQYLIISLKRFENSQFNKGKKISGHIPFSQKLDVNGLTLKIVGQQQLEKTHEYELYGLICHRGDSINSGHYISYSKVNNGTPSIWYEFSDQKNRKVPVKEVLKQEAYVLLYQKLK